MPFSTDPERGSNVELRALMATDEPFRLLVDSVKDYAIFLLDPRGRVVSWNVGAERIKGYSASAIVGQHFSRFYPPEEARAGAADVALEIAAREGRFEQEGWRVRKDGSRFWANGLITALRDQGGNLLGFAKVTRDLTERRRAEEERLRLGELARERINVLAALSEALAAATSVREVGDAVIDRGVAFARADTCTLYALDEATMELELVAERGCDPLVVDKIRKIGPDADNPSYGVGTGGRDAVFIETADAYDAFFPSLARIPAPGARARSFWCVPLRAEGHTVGMLGVGFYEERRFDDDERDFVATFARQCAQALARARGLEAERRVAALAERLGASLSTTLRSIGDAVIATDATGRITLMNRVAESLTAVSEADARGRALPEVFRIVNEHTREVVQNPVEKVLESGGIVGLANHTVLLAHDGREISIDDSGAPIRPAGGAIEGVVLVFRDVTDRKREESHRTFLADATSALSESLDYETTVARVAHLAVPRLADWCAVDLAVDGERRPKRLAVAHVDPKKIQYAKTLDEKYPPDPDAKTGVPNVLRTGRAEIYREIPDELLVAGCVDEEHLRIARELKLHSAMVVPLVVRGRVLGAMTFVLAESGRRYDDDDLDLAGELAQRCANAIENARVYSSEQQARKSADVANRAKDEFLAIVSHELRTPLNAIMGWAKMVSDHDLDERRRRNAIEIISRNSVTMAQLIEDLLDMSRVISGKMRLEIQQADVARVVNAALDSVRPTAAMQAVELTCEIEPGLPSIQADPTRLQQIVWNLASNAVKFTPRGGRVELSARRAGDSVEIRVKDTGKGIARDFLPNVFDAFRQEDASTSRARGGLGLGLAITRQLVELHGGRISAESAGDGRGSTFTVVLPTSRRPSASQPPRRSTPQKLGAAQSAERSDQLRGLRVLVVDDDDDSRELVAAVLEESGCATTTAHDVESAMHAIDAAIPDVLLSDIGMPGEDGYDLIRKVRALSRARGGETPAAALTAYARPEDRRKMLGAGYSMHLPKPVDPDELVAVVAALSRLKHAT